MGDTTLLHILSITRTSWHRSSCPSQKYFFCIKNLFRSSSQRLFWVEALTRQQVVVFRVLEKLISCFTFPCTSTVRYSLVKAPFLSFVSLKYSHNMGDRFLCSIEPFPYFFLPFMFHNLLQSLFSTWDRGRVLRVRETYLEQVTRCKKKVRFPAALQKFLRPRHVSAKFSVA